MLTKQLTEQGFPLLQLFSSRTAFQCSRWNRNTRTNEPPSTTHVQQRERDTGAKIRKTNLVDEADPSVETNIAEAPRTFILQSATFTRISAKPVGLAPLRDKCLSDLMTTHFPPLNEHKTRSAARLTAKDNWSSCSSTVKTPQIGPALRVATAAAQKGIRRILHPIALKRALNSRDPHFHLFENIYAARLPHTKKLDA